MRKLLMSAVMTSLPASMALAAPNILMVLADDMGVNASPCHDGASNMVRMPTLKALCGQGMVYDNAHAYPTCSPTRASIMTGLYASRTGVGAPVSRENSGLSADVPSLFDHLSGQGYASALIGKWHLSGARDGTHPTKLGVPYHYGPFGGGVRDYSNWSGVENGKPVRSSLYLTTALTRKAQDWIAAQDQPWFLWLAHSAPHAPFHAPPNELHRFGNLSNSLQRGQDARTHYFAALEALDTELGNLLSSLPEETRNNTLVIFAGDNGTPGRVSRRLDGNRQAKGSIYQGGTHVPLVITGPGVTTGRNHDPVQVTDLFDTILSLAGASGHTADSHDLSPTLRGRNGTRTATYIEHFSKSQARGNPVYGWTMNNGTYTIVAPEGKAPELYRAADARQSSKNLAAQNAKVVAQFQALRADFLRQ